MATYQKKLQHLYLRSGFGEKIDVLKLHLNKPFSENVNNLFKHSESISYLSLPDNDYSRISRKDLSEEERKLLRKKSRENLVSLNLQWMDRMISGSEQLREKMTLFWHGHFACRTPIAYLAMKQNNVIRKNSLGNFGGLLSEISKDPAMLQFLNNQQNRKSSPNENFAREVMELFTLGRGNYSEDDVKEAARAFTGWGFNREGEFTVRENQHDKGIKTFLGKRGNFDGDDIINILLEKQRTAEFITEKVYKYFVNENIDREKIRYLSEKFYSSGYDIKSLMNNILSSEWFYDESNIGNRIKSPVEFIASLLRTLNIEVKNRKVIVALEKALGQVLFFPPNVSGWTGGKSWIDTSTMLYRLKIPVVLFKSSNLEFDYKEISENEMNDEEIMVEKKFMKGIRTKVDISSFLNLLQQRSKGEIQSELTEYLLQAEINGSKENFIESYSDNQSKENYIESRILRIISLPEYQLN